MNMNEALQQSLYDKLSREQDKYRDWLKGQPPEEILHHSYEYTVQVPYTYYICTVKLENFNLSHVPVYILSLIHI